MASSRCGNYVFANYFPAGQIHYTACDDEIVRDAEFIE